MKQLIYLLICGLLLTACTESASDTLIQSPDGSNTIAFLLTEAGAPAYQVSRNGNTIIATSELGLEFKEQPAWKDGLELASVARG